MKRLLMILTMSSILALSVSAGDMHTGDFHSPETSEPPQGIITTSPCTSASEQGGNPSGDAVQPMVEDVLSTVLSVLGIVV